MKNLKIAVIHQEQTIADLLEKQLQWLGYSVCTYVAQREVTTPQDVASFVGEQNPSLVFLAENYETAQDLTDLMARATATNQDLPALLRGHKSGGGIAALEEIRRQFKDIPVVMVSGGPEHMEKAISLGLAC